MPFVRNDDGGARCVGARAGGSTAAGIDGALCCVEGGDPRFDSDPLVLSCYFGFLVPCCRCALCRPEAPGLYRATISSIHKTQDNPRGDEHTTARIEVLALARSPDDLRSSLRAAKEKYGAPKAAEMAR